MKILAVIPARYASTRFPGKPLAMIDGMSMIERVYRQAEKVSSIHEIIVATDDARIEQHVKDFGGKVMMTSAIHISGTDRCGEVIQKINGDFDVVINIQGDEPFIQPEQLEKVLTAFAQPETDIATLAKKIIYPEQIQDPNIVKVVFSKTGNALYFSRSTIPFARNTTEHYYKHIGIYAFRISVLQNLIRLAPTALEQAESLEQLRWLENGFSIQVVETELETTGIDTPEDLEKLLLK